MLLNTPIEQYKVAGRTVYVKREDLCAPKGWPPFSKLRGLYAYLERRQKEGLKTVGYVETSVSMAGWGVAAAAATLGMKAVIFPPKYKQPEKRDDIEWLKHHEHQWIMWGADIVPLPAARHQISWYRGRQYLQDNYGKDAELLPVGIPFDESVAQTAKVWQAVPKELRQGVTVACVGSGTIFSGLMRGWQPGDGLLTGIVVRNICPVEMLNICREKAHKLFGGFFGAKADVRIVNAGWEYYQSAKAVSPFPCHPFYDLKAWQWITEQIEWLPDPVLFWNIGNTPVSVLQKVQKKGQNK